jgi:hypothetical protein
MGNLDRKILSGNRNLPAQAKRRISEEHDLDQAGCDIADNRNAALLYKAAEDISKAFLHGHSRLYPSHLHYHIEI